jgi:transcriptional regulator with XRE-family HTH domain
MAKKGGKSGRKSHRQDPVVRAAFARVLSELRQDCKLKLQDVASASGYTEMYIGKLGRRIHTPTLTAVIFISAALKADPREVVERTLKLMPKFRHLERKDPEAADM